MVGGDGGPESEGGGFASLASECGIFEQSGAVEECFCVGEGVERLVLSIVAVGVLCGQELVEGCGQVFCERFGG